MPCVISAIIVIDAHNENSVRFQVSSITVQYSLNGSSIIYGFVDDDYVKGLIRHIRIHICHCKTCFIVFETFRLSNGDIRDVGGNVLRI